MDPATIAFLVQMAMKAGGAALKPEQNKMKQLPTKNEAQLGLLNQNIGLTQGLGGPGGGYSNTLDLWSQMLNPNSDIYNQLLAPYQQQFEQETVPGLAERFASGGGGMGGGLSSSGFGQALSSASSNLQTNLASLKNQLMQQAAGNIANQYQGLSQGAMNVDPFMYYEKQAQPSFWQKFLGGGGGGMGNMFGGGGGNGSSQGFQGFNLDTQNLWNR